MPLRVLLSMTLTNVIATQDEVSVEMMTTMMTRNRKAKAGRGYEGCLDIIIS